MPDTIGATFSMGAISKQMTLKVRVKGVQVFKLRLRIAIWIFRLGAKVAGMPVEVDVE